MAADADGMTPLHLSARGGYAACVKSLLWHRHGESQVLDATDGTGAAALHLAAAAGHADVVSILIKAGAELELRDALVRIAQKERGGMGRMVYVWKDRLCASPWSVYFPAPFLAGTNTAARGGARRPR